MSTAISDVAKCAQWAARHHDGKFGRQRHRDSGIVIAPTGPVYLVLEGDNGSTCVGPFQDPAAAEKALGSSALVRGLIEKGAGSIRFVPESSPLPQGDVAFYSVDESLETVGFVQTSALEQVA